MLDSLKHAGRNFGRSIGQNISEGWRELLNRSSSALTHFSRNKDDTQAENGALARFPAGACWQERWRRQIRRSWCGWRCPAWTSKTADRG